MMHHSLRMSMDLYVGVNIYLMYDRHHTWYLGFAGSNVLYAQMADSYDIGWRLFKIWTI